MDGEKIVWHSYTAPNGRELVTFGTPEWPIECYGPWNYTGESADILIPWHWHDELELDIVQDGAVDMMANGQIWHMEKPGQGMFVSSGVMHRTQRREGCRGYYSFVFHPWIVGGAPGSVFWQKYLTPLLEAPECRAIPLFGEADWEREIFAAVQRIARVWPPKAPGYELAMRTELSHIIFLLWQNCLHSAPVPTEKALRDAERIKTMLTYVQAHFAENLTTEQIARSASVSVSECLRCFHAMLDSTPKAYLRQYRVQRAARLLAETDRPVAEIGAACGFDDMSYFARVFRAEQGCTPSEWREQKKQAQ